MKQALYTLFNRVVFILSYLFPRKENLWVFIGWHIGPGMEIFADNSKYLFLYIANNHPEIKPVWLAKDRKLAELLCSRGYLSYYQHSLLGIWHALRAGTTVIDAFLQPENFRWSRGTHLVQLLHGRGMKKTGYNVRSPREHDYIFCPSPFVESLLAPIFKEGAVISYTGYPRNDILFHAIAGSDISTQNSWKEDLESTRAAGVTTILYAPTFRRGEQVFGLVSKFDFSKVNTWLETINARLYISLHPKYRGQTREAAYSHIFFVEESEVYPLLPLVDLLIADYSSLIYDFLLLDRPIVFFPYDLKEYSAKEGLAFPYDAYTPGPKAYDMGSLMAAVEDALANDGYAAERKRVRDIYHSHTDGHSAERIMDVLLSS